MFYEERDELVKKQLELLRNDTSDENLDKTYKEITAINRRYNESQSAALYLTQSLRTIQLLAASAVETYASVYEKDVH